MIDDTAPLFFQFPISGLLGSYFRYREDWDFGMDTRADPLTGWTLRAPMAGRIVFWTVSCSLSQVSKQPGVSCLMSNLNFEVVAPADNPNVVMSVG